MKIARGNSWVTSSREGNNMREGNVGGLMESEFQEERGKLKSKIRQWCEKSASLKNPA